MSCKKNKGPHIIGPTYQELEAQRDRLAELLGEIAQHVRLLAEFYPEGELCEGDVDAAAMAWHTIAVLLCKIEASLATKKEKQQ